MKLIEETIRLQAAYPFDIQSCALDIIKVMMRGAGVLRCRYVHFGNPG